MVLDIVVINRCSGLAEELLGPMAPPPPDT
jgi:hypothetical protein